MNQQTTPTTGANGHSALDDIFMLTDEQILEVVPETASAGGPQDLEVAEEAPSASLPGSTEQGASLPEAATEAASQSSATGNTAAAPVSFSNPEDMRAVAELYPGGLTQAKTASERARLLDDIDRAYFGAQGSTPEQARASRAELAQMMLREDPAAFREMVFAGLRALQESNVAPPFRAASSTNGANTAPATTQLSAPGNDAWSGFRTPGESTGLAKPELKPGATQTLHDPHLPAYAEFEKAANADLEKTVGGAIERALQHALPNLGRANEPVDGRARHGVPLHARLTDAIREDVEKALQGDRQLGEQVAQILAGRRFDHETRAQVVRLINDRAQQLVPGAAKRALHDWTQATLAAHRSSTSRADAVSSRREVATAAAPAANSVSAQTPRANARTPGNGRVNYRKLTDEQILDL